MCSKYRYCLKTRIFFEKFYSSMKTQFEHGLAHVKPFRVVKLKEISILMHLRIISAESDNITDRKLNSCMSGEFRKEKHNFSQLVFVYIWRPVEVAQMTAEMKAVTRSLRVVVAQRKKITRSGRLSYKRIWLER